MNLINEHRECDALSRLTVAARADVGVIANAKEAGREVGR